ncbi:MAG: YHYH protein [Acidimicrobiia bacterium]|nr:YHYH protein [Acidimicrobiia bacterium]
MQSRVTADTASIITNTAPSWCPPCSSPAGPFSGWEESGLVRHYSGRAQSRRAIQRIPMNPVIADVPVSAKTQLYRGAIALAANGVPIFNALNNRGDDAYLYGELDQWGGHAGRADDYHYHIAPLHLQDTVGANRPIAYALDGYPIYGETEPDGSAVGALDEFNGHTMPDGAYHYHGTRTYPYINGGLRGVVNVVGDQIDPQPVTKPFRDALQPLAGATIVSFDSPASGSGR